jgi:hypothetical protein
VPTPALQALEGASFFQSRDVGARYATYVEVVANLLSVAVGGGNPPYFLVAVCIHIPMMPHSSIARKTLWGAEGRLVADAWPA